MRLVPHSIQRETELQCSTPNPWRGASVHQTEQEFNQVALTLGFLGRERVDKVLQSTVTTTQSAQKREDSEHIGDSSFRELMSGAVLRLHSSSSSIGGARSSLGMFLAGSWLLPSALPVATPCTILLNKSWKKKHVLWFLQDAEWSFCQKSLCFYISRSPSI